MFWNGIRLSLGSIISELQLLIDRYTSLKYNAVIPILSPQVKSGNQTAYNWIREKNHLFTNLRLQNTQTLMHIYVLDLV